MRFYDTSNTHDSLVHHANFLVGTDTTSYPLADQARAANIWIGKILGWIFEVQGAAEFDDPNYTDFPIATTALVAAQQDYVLPGATSSGSPNQMVQLIGVSILDSNSIWHACKQINWDDYKGIDRAELFKTNGLPLFYDWVANSIFLYPAPASGYVTLAAGLKAYFTRSQDLLTATDTTQSPPFAAIFHEAVAVGMAYEYAASKNNPKKGDMLVQLYGGVKDGATVEGWKDRIQKFYTQRNLDRGIFIGAGKRERGQYR